MNHSSEQKTIAINTVFLYLRMIVVMLVSLYTSRIVLDKLGVEDYGIYNIVGSVIVSFSFVKNSLMSSTQRFMSYEKGKPNGNCSSVYQTSLFIHIILLSITILLLETVGLWFIKNVIQIPEQRQTAAVFVYHLSIITFGVNLIQVPYTALIVSNEKMSVYAFISIIDVLFKLLIAYLISLPLSSDKLVLYASLVLIVTITCNIIVIMYCHIRLKKDCEISFVYNKRIFREMFAFSSWNLLGGISSVACTEGPNYFINYYLGVTVNAALGIAKQVSNAVYSFSSNFQTAFNPQIVKSYANDDRNYMFDLIFRTSKFSFFLVFVIALPLIICIKDILALWLTTVPKYTDSFCICILFAQIVSAISSPLWMAAHAIGNIRSYQLILIAFNLIIIPSSWIILYVGGEPYLVISVQIIINILILLYRVYYLKIKIAFPALKFLKDVLYKCCLLHILILFPVCYCVSSYFDGIYKIIITTFLTILMICPTFYLLGLNKEERSIIRSFIVSKFTK